MPWDEDEPFTASSASDDVQGGGPDMKSVRRFTLSKLNELHNTRVAVRGKVGDINFLHHQ